MNTSAHVFIKGEVQGVFYRVWVRTQAERLGLTGWVKNLTDGRVEAVFEGPKDKIEEIINKCKIGPSVAGVKYVEVKWKKATKEHTGFEIER
ncbi:acylphosphatase [Patescibacteria group bacterium]|nr:acylphosphatase [Patescibacteria group bacterium]MBU0777440.1 acylphosphatase [Patescibacteria group bacterium]MBU0846075.1 acylphosphatase [Patescibacteria group bacterium]MBU0923128.1 acylphosphatase [Patescibacteria group bacterium]MBU1066843.1 acylphosphatase [Patescibacteria group bacterium]